MFHSRIWPLKAAMHGLILKIIVQAITRTILIQEKSANTSFDDDFRDLQLLLLTFFHKMYRKEVSHFAFPLCVLVVLAAHVLLHNVYFLGPFPVQLQALTRNRRRKFHLYSLNQKPKCPIMED